MGRSHWGWGTHHRNLVAARDGVGDPQNAPSSAHLALVRGGRQVDGFPPRHVRHRHPHPPPPSFHGCGGLSEVPQCQRSDFRAQHLADESVCRHSLVGSALDGHYITSRDGVHRRLPTSASSKMAASFSFYFLIKLFAFSQIYTQTTPALSMT